MARVTINRRVLLSAAAALGLGGSAFVETVLASPALATDYVQYQLPFPASSITQHSNSGHVATDFGWGISQGDPIPAIADGVVHDKKSGGSLGYRIELKHADGAYSAYCHMNSNSSLQIGDSVSRGSTIGHVGNSGVTAYHLHLGMSTVAGAALSAQYSNCFDPEPYISARLEPQPGDLMGIFLKTTTGGNVWHYMEEFNFRTFSSQAEAQMFGNVLPQSIVISTSNRDALSAHCNANRATLVAEIAAAVVAAQQPA
jgi:hypothetical protein